MINCHLEVIPKGYITSMYVLSAITLPVDLFGVYCIIAKSPSIMKDYSRLLLVYQICATVTDTWTNLLFIPIAFLPFPIVYHAGILFSRTEIHYSYVFITWLCMIITTMGSVVQLFIFRWQAMLMKDHLLRLNKKLIYAICFTFFFIFNGAVVAAGFTMPNRIDELKPMYIQNFTCIAEMVDLRGVQYFQQKDYQRLFLVTTVGATIVVTIALILVYLTSRTLQNKNVSQKTIDMQRRYQISLILQVVIPIFVVIAPGCAVMMFGVLSDIYLSITYTLHIQVVTNIVLCLISAHGLFGTIIMVIVNQPYRRFAIDCFRRGFGICMRTTSLDSDMRRRRSSQVRDARLSSLAVNN
ncbi:7TM chemoreceptor [Trichostrongylus colubriformis]|uniref:7TM chemoreceptor n=1 Tax=Trichostrongylus colubriformis TaxID=6319 RepID=A0AAN8F5X9_TRICO